MFENLAENLKKAGGGHQRRKLGGGLGAGLADQPDFAGFAKRLEALGVGVTDEAKKQLAEDRRKLSQALYDECPVDTGALRASIVTETTEDGGFSVRVGGGIVTYARPVLARDNFFRRAVERAGIKSERILLTVLDE